MIDYDDEFMTFYEAMVAKLDENRLEKGDSWKDEHYRVGDTTFSMEPYLRSRLKEAIDLYENWREPRQLVKIANYCAMLWTRGLKGSMKE